MKNRFFPFSALIALGMLPMVPAFAQQATPLPPPPGMTATPAPAAEAQLAPVPVPPAPVAGDDPRACKHTKVIDGIPYKWDKLEKGTDEAWQAYMNGDYVSSVPVFAKLADIGHPVAQRLMGVAYFFGQGVPLDYVTSLTWLEKAAMQGCFEAYAATAQMYESGKGTMPDLGKAYMWYNIAASYLPQGKDRKDMIDRREKVAGAMTPAQIEAAQKRSLQFKPVLVTPPDLSELPDDFFKKP
ncbi:tetratricopeptide repeat protein [Dongia rigui]|uniref:Tetratricopeptide repeat protein n=1 Tax=Dongia rigui TaxID=940149 RepID=A0ABU5DTI5_9PROT|nr:tetratricopeptide repeat protein [Dongia rigui]MDY0870653.1 tetratricopeptide repeat protein [Dongia rigui]